MKRSIVGRFVALLLATALLSGALPSIAIAQSFEQPADRLAYLAALRRADPRLYNDFILRFDPIPFLGSVQQARNTVGYAQTPISGLEIDVLVESTTQPVSSKRDQQNLELDWKKIEDTIRSEATTKPNELAAHALKFEIERAAILNALNTVLARSSSIPDGRALLQLDLEARVLRLKETMPSIEVVEWADAKLLGVSTSEVSGAQFLEAYQNAMTSRTKVQALLLGGLLSKTVAFAQLHVKDIAAIITGKNSDAIRSLPDGEALTNEARDLLKEGGIPNGRINGLLSDFVNWTKRFRPQTNNTAETARLILRSSHPDKSVMRGCRVGDCSTRKGYAQVYLGTEHVLDILDAKDKSEKGYMQFSMVMTEGKPALFLHTVSGNRLSKADATAAVVAATQLAPHLGAEFVVLPPEERIFFFINFQDIQTVYRDAIKGGKKVALQYSDGPLRAALAKLIENDLDSPSKNPEAIILENPSRLLEGVRIQTRASKQASDTLFASPRRSETIMMALELAGFEKKIDEILELAGIKRELFDATQEILSNKERLPVRDFQQKAFVAVQALGAEVTFELFTTSNVLFRGHMNAPDALTGENLNTAISYIEPRLLSYERSRTLFRAIRPHLEQLGHTKRFQTLVKTLFRRHFDELRQPMLHYDVAFNSARRTLLNLFHSGLPKSVFEKELKDLEISIENDPRFAEHHDRIAVRRLSFLASLSGFEAEPTTRFMSWLENRAKSAQPLQFDDMKVAASFIDALLNSGKASPAQLQKINTLVTKTSIGVSMAATLLKNETPGINEPALIKALIDYGKFSWLIEALGHARFAKNAQAKTWLNVIHANRAKLEGDQFIQLFTKTPEWISVAVGTEAAKTLLESAPTDSPLREKLHHEQSLAGLSKGRRCAIPAIK